MTVVDLNNPGLPLTIDIHENKRTGLTVNPHLSSKRHAIAEKSIVIALVNTTVHCRPTHMPVDSIVQVKHVEYATRLNSTALQKIWTNRSGLADWRTLIDSPDRPCISHPARLTFPRFPTKHRQIDGPNSVPPPLLPMYSVLYAPICLGASGGAAATRLDLDLRLIRSLLSAAQGESG